MEYIRKILIEAGYSVPTAYSFTNGNRDFLSDRQKKAIRLAMKNGCLDELLSIPNNTSRSDKSATTNQKEGI